MVITIWIGGSGSQGHVVRTIWTRSVLIRLPSQTLSNEDLQTHLSRVYLPYYSQDFTRLGTPLSTL